MNVLVAILCAAAGCVELFILLIVAKLSPWLVLILVAVTGAFGAYYVAREGAAVGKQMQEHSQASMDMPPPLLVIEMFFIATGAALLIGPGILTHVAGIFLVFPKSREKLKERALAKMMEEAAKRMQAAGESGPGASA